MTDSAFARLHTLISKVAAFRAVKPSMRRFRFSLGSLCLFVLLLGSIATVWVRRKPWAVTREWKAHEEELIGLKSVDHGAHILTIGERYDPTIKLWDARTGSLLNNQRYDELVAPTFSLVEPGVFIRANDAILSPDGELMLVCWRGSMREDSVFPTATLLYQRNGLHFDLHGYVWIRRSVLDRSQDTISDIQMWESVRADLGQVPITAIHDENKIIVAGWSFVSDFADTNQSSTSTILEFPRKMRADGLHVRGCALDGSCVLCGQETDCCNVVLALPDLTPIATLEDERPCSVLIDRHYMLSSNKTALTLYDLSRGEDVWSIAPGWPSDFSISFDHIQFMKLSDDRHSYEICDFKTGKQMGIIRLFEEEQIFFDSACDRMISCCRKGIVRIRERRFPEWWWGHLLRPEVWVLIVCAGLCALQIIRFIRTRRRA